MTVICHDLELDKEWDFMLEYPYDLEYLILRLGNLHLRLS